MSAEPIDFGHGVSGAIVVGSDGKPSGLTFWHPCKLPDGTPDDGQSWVPFAGANSSGHGSPGWTVGSLDPLTLAPSLLCRSCGHHGYIRGGRWIPV